jgi:hypothetical protein
MTDAAGVTTRLTVRLALSAPRDAARAALGPLRASWLGTPVAVDPGQRASDRYELDLELPMGGSATSISLRKAALVDVGPLTDLSAGGQGGERLCVAISWQAASMAPLFPVFSGTLCWTDGELQVDGYYAPPGGRVGVAADRILSRVVAERTARWLLGRVAYAMHPSDRDPGP